MQKFIGRNGAFVYIYNMIKNNKIKVPISYRNVTHYLKLGYDAIINTELEISIKDLPIVSHVKIDACCEICEKVTNIMYCKYVENKKRHGFYSCKSCSRHKSVLTSREIYGVDNYMMLEESKKMVSENNIKKYGVKTTLLEKNTKLKISKTMIEKYGTDKFYEIRTPTKNKKFKFNGFDSVDSDITDPSNKYRIIHDESYSLYRNEVRRLTKKVEKLLYDNWDGFDYYDGDYIKENFTLNHNDPKYPTIDHMKSIYYGFNNTIPASEIGDISNLCITKRSINSSKREL